MKKTSKTRLSCKIPKLICFFFFLNTLKLPLFFLIEWSMNALKTLVGKKLAAAGIN